MASSNHQRDRHGSAVRQLRIIGGQWRGRKLAFTPAEGLRPTGDRVRETLFNWLAPMINEARCADLFAGSGALGLEALSRGALHCDFVDTSAAAIKQIGLHLETLDARGRADCHTLPATQYLETAAQSLDIVFIDPPFDRALTGECCQALAKSGQLSDQALIYIETPTKEALTYLPEDWDLHREKSAGGVAFRLFRHSAD